MRQSSLSIKWGVFENLEDLKICPLENFLKNKKDLKRRTKNAFIGFTF
jgi:hypothetical protein